LPYTEKKEIIELVRGCQEQNPQAQAAFYNHYKRRLLGVCRRYAHTTFEAEDLFQEAFIKIFKYINNLKEPERVGLWVKSVLIRTAIDYFRKHNALYVYENEENEGDFTEKEDDFSILDVLEREQVLEIIHKMPEGYRLVVNLYLIDGYEHAEIAEMLGISIGTSKSQLSRAKQYLRTQLSFLAIKKYEKG
jgi:RNA polymerase sigma factor (sigma-70 family)